MTKTSFPTPKNPYLYLPDGWDTCWKAAKLTSATAPVVVTGLGDSVLMGAQATSAMTTGFFGLLRSKLQALYGLYGDYYNANLLNGTADYNGTLPWIAVANNTLQVGGSFVTWIQNTNAVAFGTTGDFSFTTPYACTAMDFIGRDTLSGGPWTWQYNVDNAGGTGLVTYTLGGGTALNVSPYRVAVTGLSNATHVVRFGNANVSGGMAIHGVITYNPGATSGLFFSNIAVTGSYAYNFSNGPSGVFPYQGMQGWYKSNSTTTLKTGFGYPSGASLAILQWGINDCASFQPPLEMYTHSLRRIIQGLRRATANCSVVLHIPCCPDPDSSDAVTLYGGAAVNNKNWWRFMDIMYAVAREYNCAVVNTHASWGETPLAKGFITSGDPHPTDAGYVDIVNSFMGIL